MFMSRSAPPESITALIDVILIDGIAENVGLKSVVLIGFVFRSGQSCPRDRA